MKMNFELKSNTLIKINEKQVEIQLPLIWKMQNNLFKQCTKLEQMKWEKLDL
jgi:capsule polysaccharide export protein KpsE/RkpR